MTKQVDHSSEINKCISDLFASGKFTDLIIEVDKETFHVHSAILASRAEYFRALLYGGLSETNQKYVKLCETPSDAFRRILCYIYTGKLDLTYLNIDDLISTFKLAHQYGFICLSTDIANSLKIHANTKNISTLLNFSIIYDQEPLIYECLRVINSNASKFLNSNNFFCLSKDSVERVLTQDGFYAPEIEIFRALKWWLHSFQKEYLRSVNDASLQDKRESLIEKLNKDCKELMTKCIRLELIPMKYLLSEIRSSNLFPSDKILDILTKQSKYNSKNYNDEFRYRGMFLPGINLVNDSTHMTIENNDSSDEYRINNGQNEKCDSLRIFTNDETASKNSTTSSTSILQDPLMEETRENDGFTNNETNDTDDINLPSSSRNPGFRIQSDDGLENPPSDSKPEYSVPPIIPHESMSTPSLSVIATSKLNRTSEPESYRQPKKGFTRAGSLSQVTSPKGRPFSTNPSLSVRLRQPLSVGNFQINRPDRKLFINSIKSSSIDANNFDGFSPLSSSNHVTNRQWMKHQISSDDYWQQASANITITLHKPSLVNHIRLRLWDKELRSYSYYIDVSYDRFKWTTVVDYRDYECRSFQQIFFPTRVIQYIRIVGTKNTTSNYFHLTNVECMLIEKPQISVNGFVCPNGNVALLNLGATVLEGVSRDRNALISTNPSKYTWKWGYTCHQLGNGAILVQLGQPYFVSSLRFLLYDHDDRSYGYTVEIFDGKTEWKMVSNKSNELCQGWQVITFKRQLVSYIKVIGKNNTADNVFHLIHLECPHLPAETDSYAEKMKSDQITDTSADSNPSVEMNQANSSLVMTNNMASTNAVPNNEDIQSQGSLIESLTPSLPLATDITDGSMHFSTNSSFIE